jgi:glycopeptide antibiotics resistance protein
MWHSGSFKLMFENVFGNILLFVPLGFFLPLLVRKCRNVFIMFIIGTGTSFLIETMQYEYAKRIFDVDDIFLNVIGAMTGWLVALIVVGIFKLLKKAGE